MFADGISSMKSTVLLVNTYKTADIWLKPTSFQKPGSSTNKNITANFSMNIFLFKYHNYVGEMEIKLQILIDQDNC